MEDAKMKKEYINPELEVVDLKMNCTLMAGSPTAPLDDTNPQSNEDALAPGFVFDE